MATETTKIQLDADGQSQRYTLRRGFGLQALGSKDRDCPLEFDCRKADCGICLIRIRTGAENLSAPSPQERDFLKAMQADPDERLACQCRVMGDIHISLDDFGPQ